MKFSQRIGITPANKTLQIENIDDDLRNSLWNAVKIFFLNPVRGGGVYSSEFEIFCNILWIHFYKLPVDSKPSGGYEQEDYIRRYFFKAHWYEVFDLLELIAKLNVNQIHYDKSEFIKFCNTSFERENSGYRFIESEIAPITNSTEIKEIEEAIDNSGRFSAFKGANTHLNNSLDKLSDKTNPDYRNSIKESISAVEVVAKTVSKGKNDTLGAALDKIKGKTKIHPALERGFKQIYGYTSDGDGIRHALMEESTCSFEDAKFMLVSCSAFINYLIAKAAKAGIDLNN